MGIYDVEVFFLGGGALEQLHRSFRDIGAHLEFQKPEFVMHELLLKELCTYVIGPKIFKISTTTPFRPPSLAKQDMGKNVLFPALSPVYGGQGRVQDFSRGGAEFHSSGKNLGEYAGEKLSAPPPGPHLKKTPGQDFL